MFVNGFMGKRPLVWDQESGGELKAVSLLTGVWSCGVKSQVTEVVRVHLGIWELCKAQYAVIVVVCVIMIECVIDCIGCELGSEY